MKPRVHLEPGYAGTAPGRTRISWQELLAASGIIAAVAVLLYAPSLHAPWYLDDTAAIVENPLVHGLGYSLRDLIFSRGLALFTFSLNYHFGGTDTFGYHLINVALHAGCGILVFLLLRPLGQGKRLLPLLGALLFIVHPLQTQTVTYVVQRMALLSAFFFLLALLLFVKAFSLQREGAPFFSGRHLADYLGSLLCGLIALSCKENAAVLPVALYMYVVFFTPPPRDRKSLLWSLLPFAIAPLLFVVIRLLVPLAGGSALLDVTRTIGLQHTPQPSPLHYLVTEFSVLWIYLRMLFFPYGQTLHHSYPLTQDLFAVRHLLAGTGLALLGTLAVWLRHRQPLITAGIAWFFLTLAVESSVIPLDPLFEHRLYLPMFGFVLAVLGLLAWMPGDGRRLAVLALLVILCLPLAWQRNRLWADPVAFFRDNLAKVPHSERAMADLAYQYMSGGQPAEAEKLLLQAVASDRPPLEAYINLVALYTNQGRLAEGIIQAQQGLTHYPNSAKLRTNLGVLHYSNNDYAQAFRIFDQTVRNDPDYAPAGYYRLKALAALGRWPEAESGFRQRLAGDAGNLAVRNDLALALLQQGKNREAEGELQYVLARDPQNAAALYNLGMLAINRGGRSQAALVVQRLRPVAPQLADELDRQAALRGQGR